MAVASRALLPNTPKGVRKKTRNASNNTHTPEINTNKPQTGAPRPRAGGAKGKRVFLPSSDTELGTGPAAGVGGPRSQGCHCVPLQYVHELLGPSPRTALGCEPPGVPVMEIRLGSQEADHRVWPSLTARWMRRPGAMGALTSAPCSTSTFRVSRNPVRAASYGPEWCLRRPGRWGWRLASGVPGQWWDCRHHDLVGWG